MKIITKKSINDNRFLAYMLQTEGMQDTYKQCYSCLLPGLYIALLVMLNACNSAGSLGDQPLSFDGFTGQFPRLTLPYHYTSDSLLSADPDTLQIKDARQAQFIPDSVLFPDGDTTAAVYAIGRGRSDEAQKQWVFLKTVTPEAKRVFVLIYNSKDSLIVAKKVAAREESAQNKTLTFKWTKNHLLNVYERTALGSGYVSYSRKVYSLLGGDRLQLILTNKSDPKGMRQKR